MKHIIIIAALIAAPFTTTLHAEHEKVLLAIDKATWDDSPSQREKIETFFQRFVTAGQGVTPQAIYLRSSNSNEVMVACYDSGTLNDHNDEDITELKMEELRVSLDDEDIKVEYASFPHVKHASWGLVAPTIDEEL